MQLHAAYAAAAVTIQKRQFCSTTQLSSVTSLDFSQCFNFCVQACWCWCCWQVSKRLLNQCELGLQRYEMTLFKNPVTPGQDCSLPAIATTTLNHFILAAVTSIFQRNRGYGAFVPISYFGVVRGMARSARRAIMGQSAKAAARLRSVA